MARRKSPAEEAGFSPAEIKALKERHAAFKKARKEGKLKEYRAARKAEQDKADKKRSDTLKARHKLWKTDRKEYNKQKRAHYTKEYSDRYDAAQERQDAFNKRTKRGKYSKRHKAKQEKIYGKGLKRQLGRAKRFLSGGLLASKEAKEDVKSKLKVKKRQAKRRQRAISRNVEREMNR
tara:strand:- start:721 stop:1254 length:534 start_codon:yes stop_codon:yes gene_type:complete